MVARPYQAIATGLGLGSVIVIGMTGSLAGFDDSIFPADSLPHAVVQDFSSSSHILSRLRLLQPIAVVIGSIYVLWLLQNFWRSKSARLGCSFLPSR